MTKAEQEYWVTKLPSVLLLQMQRVAFDKKTKMARKITNPVGFSKCIYVDRFMLENRAASSAIRATVREDKKKIRALEQALSSFKSFGPDKLSLPNVLSTTVHFLQNQNEGMKTEQEEGVKLFSPGQIGDLGHGAESMKQTVELLGGFEKTVREQIGNMEAQLAEYQNKVAHSYDHMQKYKYQLHSIIIHSGQADSGHYYAYIYDFEQRKWRKYNDMQVVEVAEEEVFKNAVGEENSLTSAYCLVYVSKANEMRVSSPNAIVRQYSLTDSAAVAAGVKGKKDDSPHPQKKIIDYYSSLMPAKLKQEVVADNVRLEAELAEYKAGQMMARLQVLYTERLEVIAQLKEQKPYEGIFPLFNFVCYLESKNEPLARWHLLDVTLKELSEGGASLTILEKTDPICKKLNEKFMKLCKNCPKSLDLSDADRRHLDELRSSYLRELANYNFSRHIFRCLIAKDWTEAEHGLCFYLMKEFYPDSGTRKRMADVTKMLSLRLCSRAAELLMKRSADEFVEVVRLLSQLCIFIIEKDDAHTKYVSMIMNYMYTAAAEMFTPEQQNAVSAYLNDISVHNTSSANVPTNEPPKVTNQCLLSRN